LVSLFGFVMASDMPSECGYRLFLASVDHRIATSSSLRKTMSFEQFANCGNEQREMRFLVKVMILAILLCNAETNTLFC